MLRNSGIPGFNFPIPLPVFHIPSLPHFTIPGFGDPSTGYGSGYGEGSGYGSGGEGGGNDGWSRVQVEAVGVDKVWDGVGVVVVVQAVEVVAMEVGQVMEVKVGAGVGAGGQVKEAVAEVKVEAVEVEAMEVVKVEAVEGARAVVQAVEATVVVKVEAVEVVKVEAVEGARAVVQAVEAVEVEKVEAVEVEKVEAEKVEAEEGARAAVQAVEAAVVVMEVVQVGVVKEEARLGQWFGQ